MRRFSLFLIPLSLVGQAIIQQTNCPKVLSPGTIVVAQSVTSLANYPVVILACYQLDLTQFSINNTTSPPTVHIYNSPGGSGGAEWGYIAGTLSSQTDLVAALALLQPLSSKGVANGYASLDSNSLVPINQIPTLNQSTTGNSATTTALASAPTQCSANYFPLGIDIHGNALNCSLNASGSGGSVTSVFSRVGGVIATSGDYSFSQISGTATGSQVPSLQNLTGSLTLSQLSLGGGSTNQFLSITGGVWTPTSLPAAPNFSMAETPSGSVDGINTTFIVSHTPILNSMAIYLNGLRMQPGGDYTISGTSFTFQTASMPQTGDTILVDYRY